MTQRTITISVWSFSVIGFGHIRLGRIDANPFESIVIIENYLKSMLEFAFFENIMVLNKTNCF